MALFSEYAVTPDVFNESCYDSPADCAKDLRQLREVFFNEGLVRNLRNGEWRKFFLSTARPWHRDTDRILKNLITACRLVPSDPALGHTPHNDREWCNEALASHNTIPLNGIIVSDVIRKTYRNNEVVESVNRLSLDSCEWWTPTTSSRRLNRTIKDYKDALKLILRHANSIMFIDPYIDPSQNRYADFGQLLEAAGNRPPKSPRPLVEIHRQIRRGSGKNAPLWDQQNMENTFRNKFGPVLEQSNLKVEVFVWDDFHDRFLISNLVGIQMSNGFDTSPTRTAWSRLGQSDRDDVQREFTHESKKSNESKKPKFRFKFKIP